MKTLADFKRAMQKGTRWNAYHHRSESFLGERICTHADTVKFGFSTDRGTSYCYWPKATDFAFNEQEGADIFYTDNDGKQVKILTYTKA